MHGKQYPQMHLVSCPCKLRHKKGCGCMTDTSAFSARAKYIAALNDAGTDPQKFFHVSKCWPTTLGMSTNGRVVSVTFIPFACVPVDNVRSQLFIVRGKCTPPLMF